MTETNRPPEVKEAARDLLRLIPETQDALDSYKALKRETEDQAMFLHAAIRGGQDQAARIKVDDYILVVDADGKVGTVRIDFDATTEPIEPIEAMSRDPFQATLVEPSAPVLTPREREVYAILQRESRKNADPSSWFYVSSQFIADRLGVSRSNVAALLVHLEKNKGVLVRDRSSGSYPYPMRLA